MFRLLALLQLTRAALAFTAIADAWAVLLLRPPSELPRPKGLLIAQMVVMGVASFGLYAFGMTLNDLLDARRDRIFAPRRPIPSGRIHPRSAVVTALVLLMAALLASAFMTFLNLMERGAPWTVSDFLPYSLFFAFATAGLIVFYDATSKYLGGIGLVTLGAIRALHCLIGNPKTPLLFLSMILLTHVIVVSTISYRLENKRPRLRRRDVWAVVLGLLVGNGAALWYMWQRGALVAGNLQMLIGPAIAGAVYAIWAIRVLMSDPPIAPHAPHPVRETGLGAGTAVRSARHKGERLMLMGLFWLFVYDASMLLSNGQYLAGLAITLLLLCAIGSFFGIRFLSRRGGQTPSGTNPGKVGYRIERGQLPAPRP